MTQFYDALKALISPAMVTRASTLLNEKESDLNKATSSIISSFLGVLLKKGNSPQIREILEEAGNLNILAEIKDLWMNDLTKDQQRLGDNFTQQLLGDKAADFTDPIASQAGISQVATNKLVAMIAPIVTGYLGNKMVQENFSLHGIIREIDKEKSKFSSLIPSALVRTFGLSDVLSNDGATTVNQREEKKGGLGWLKWLILIVALLLLFLWWKSCQEDKSEVIAYSETVTTRDTVPQNNTRSNATSDTQREKYEITLPNGVKIQAYKGGVEDKMINFLNSDEYKNATDEQLKEKWFEFDDLAFEFGSPTELQSKSQTQLDNIAAILKSYKDAKIRIGGFADKVGTEKTNMEISKERAKTIETMLDKKGIGNQIVKTEGFGDEYAKHSPQESNEKRAEDRDIALRFVKK